LEMSSDFFSRVGGAGSPLPFIICPGEGKVGFGIEGQLRPLQISVVCHPSSDASFPPSQRVSCCQRRK
jgi:hypothetical protein